MSASLPFSGLRVLELGTVLSGPFAGSMLADLGAEVIKIETPGKGDVQRFGGHKKNGVAPWWSVASRDKHCITLNLKHPEGKAIFEKLIRRADVLVENYRPGALEKLGFGWDAVNVMNPKLVVLSISGYGRTGPSAGRPGFGKIAEGLSGVVTMTGQPEVRPLFIGFSLADTCSGLFGVLGVAMALYDRDINGGRGHRVDMGLYEPLFRMLDCQLAIYAKLGKPPVRTGSNDAYGWGLDKSRPPFFCVQAGNGEWFLTSVPSAAAARELAAGQPGDSDQQRFAAWAKTLAPMALREALSRAGGDIVPVLDGLSLARNDYMRARGDVIDTTDAKAGDLTVPGWIAPAPADGEVRRTFNDAALGERSAFILERDLGYGSADIDRLKSEGVI
ncbi:MAG: CoA transferase [Betaproteobacteria bacterium]|nr:CoA transferase [Betaproteobacteria bacterium]